MHNRFFAMVSYCHIWGLTKTQMVVTDSALVEINKTKLAQARLEKLSFKKRV